MDHVPFVAFQLYKQEYKITAHNDGHYWRHDKEDNSGRDTAYHYWRYQARRAYLKHPKPRVMWDQS